MTDLNELTKRVDAQDGNLVFKADIGAAIENENACQNKEALPQPRSYGAKARFGRRFDESLLVEVDLVGFTTRRRRRRRRTRSSTTRPRSSQRGEDID